MAERAMVEELEATFAELDRMAEADQEAQGFDLGRDRIAFVHRQLQGLQAEFVALRVAAELQQACLGETGGTGVWRETRAEVRQRWPRGMGRVGRALQAADSALLEIVAFTSGAAATARERRCALAERLRAWHPERRADGEGVIEGPAEHMIAILCVRDELTATQLGEIQRGLTELK